MRCETPTPRRGRVHFVCDSGETVRRISSGRRRSGRVVKHSLYERGEATMTALGATVDVTPHQVIGIRARNTLRKPREHATANTLSISITCRVMCSPKIYHGRVSSTVAGMGID